MTKNCKECRKLFVSTVSNRTICSLECRTARNNRLVLERYHKNKPAPKIRKRHVVKTNCLACSTEFEYYAPPSSSARKYCSKTCSARGRNRIRKGEDVLDPVAEIKPIKRKRDVPPREWDDDAVLRLMYAIFGDEWLKEVFIK